MKRIPTPVVVVALLPLLAIGALIGAGAVWLAPIRESHTGELPAACEDLVMAADQAMIGAGQVVADATAATPTAGRGLTRLQREAQLQTVADRYERARDACLEASR